MTNTTQTRCQMNCGGCRNEATLVLHTKRTVVDAMNLLTLKLVKMVQPAKTVFACEKHRKNLSRIAELRGGTVKAVAR